VAEIEEWREKFLLGAENALRSRPKDEEALKDEQIKKLKQKIGNLVLDNDITGGLETDGMGPSFFSWHAAIAVIGRYAMNDKQGRRTYASRDCGD
jgi:hypothetical protein